MEDFVEALAMGDLRPFVFDGVGHFIICEVVAMGSVEIAHLAHFAVAGRGDRPGSLVCHCG